MSYLLERSSSHHSCPTYTRITMPTMNSIIGTV
jgi:hypothetical protein